jgi:hypothetical protein
VAIIRGEATTAASDQSQLGQVYYERRSLASSDAKEALAHFADYE